VPQGVLDKVGLGRAAKEIQNGSKKAIANAAKRVIANRDLAIKKLKTASPATPIRDLCAPLLVKRQIPGATWAVHWRAEPKRAPQAEVIESFGNQLSARFLSEPDSGFWSAPIAIADLGLALSLPLPSRGGGLKETLLSSYIITEVECSKDGESFRLQKKARKLKDGFVVVVRKGERTTPLLCAVTASGERTGDEVVLAGNAVNDIANLWALLRRRFPALVMQRRSLVELRLGEMTVDEIDQPAALARLFLDLCAPLCQEMRKKSARLGQIMLEKVDEAGHVQAQILPAPWLEKRLMDLPVEQQEWFAAAGLHPESAKRTLTDITRAITQKLPPRIHTERLPTVDDSGPRGV
jgi:hypothetical protein